MFFFPAILLMSVQLNSHTPFPSVFIWVDMRVFVYLILGYLVRWYNSILSSFYLLVLISVLIWEFVYLVFLFLLIVEQTIMISECC